jgi:hypothetical protein
MLLKNSPFGFVLVLNLHQLLVIGAKERGLPILVLGVGFVDASPPPQWA